MEMKEAEALCCAQDSEVLIISAQLLEENREAYAELAK